MSEDENDNIHFRDRGLLMGHSDWVTSIVSGHKIKDKTDSNLLVSGSRDRSLIIW